ncbi:MAG: hypothetical protein EWV53_17165 [Microcystis panniformis Mp_MB_F_20051200_S9]|uniref:Uncharacterized protein n=1 Tax=Microcystis panniformis Mp_MB_F_20051200_S9 TaxID=2486223 RepID=A0A552PQL2_9CHRO|nr:MAG: hypothetical protein EWV87_20370 [Microcystis panniformis Mp_GB_SS_20050300_S99]TRV46232.1 MAG: hypothetical protein EWV42_18625 [Microcystis panniformis Mp_GB_SS_20050300_S99D]TRV52489.1 MAG: hypothetical protein EWV43_02135 [Microcystis panniformis Mp_MB_F_20080800_S26D]TRV58348.1 MAG: hypothetical protein EWV69_14080 [Microcystis panniformis Mp_MB_F_20080800_S26]TRV59278.1 MAG: hypothetical protein EWV53_17165 [Microcystis panniformis Mp_MB_F_20051200_S9]TRV61137.1 MAG: hypothetical
MLRLIPLFCPIAIWLVLLFFFTALFLAIAEARGRLRKLHRIPCSRCVFCTGDYRLKCAVHPVRAFSEEAIDCRDFEPEIQENPLNSRSLLTATFHRLWSISKRSVVSLKNRGNDYELNP